MLAGGRLVVVGCLRLEEEDKPVVLSASNPLQKSSVQRHAMMESSPGSTFLGLHSGKASTGSLILPRRIPVEKHSRITARGSPGDLKSLEFFSQGNH